MDRVIDNFTGDIEHTFECEDEPIDNEDILVPSCELVG